MNKPSKIYYNKNYLKWIFLDTNEIVHESQLTESYGLTKVVMQTQKVCKTYRAYTQLVSSSIFTFVLCMLTKGKFTD